MIYYIYKTLEIVILILFNMFLVFSIPVKFMRENRDVRL